MVRDFGTWQVGILPFLPVPGLPLSGFGTCQTWRLATGPVGWLVRVFKVKIQWQCYFSLHWLVREGSKNQLLWLIEMIINNVIVAIFSIKFPIPPHKGGVCIVPCKSKRLGFCPLIWVDALSPGFAVLCNNYTVLYILYYYILVYCNCNVSATLQNYSHCAGKMFFASINAMVGCGSKSVNGKKRKGIKQTWEFPEQRHQQLRLVPLGSSFPKWCPVWTTSYVRMWHEACSKVLVMARLRRVQFCAAVCFGISMSVCTNLRCKWSYQS